MPGASQLDRAIDPPESGQDPPHQGSTEIYMFIGPHTLYQFRVICTLFLTANGHTGVPGG